MTESNSIEKKKLKGIFIYSLGALMCIENICVVVGKKMVCLAD